MRDELVNKLMEVSVGWWEANVTFLKLKKMSKGKKKNTGNWVFTFSLTFTIASLRGEKNCSWCKNSFRGKSENWIKLRLICNAVKNSFPSASPWVKRNTFDPQYPIDYAVSSQKASEHESSQFSKTLRTNQQKENFSLTFQRESPLSTFSTKKRENLGTKRR